MENVKEVGGMTLIGVLMISQYVSTPLGIVAAAMEGSWVDALLSLFVPMYGTIYACAQWFF